MKKNGGFTLMELLIVIAIIMILAGAIVARVGTGTEKAKKAKATAELEEITTACRAFYLDTTLWPANATALIIAPVTGYDERGTTPVSIPSSSWKGPYLEVTGTAVPNDPWNHPYLVERNTTTTPAALQARSWGTNGANGGNPNDDIICFIHKFGT